mgnify:CR=1 FL=1
MTILDQLAGHARERVAEAQNRVAYSASILDNDYYRVVFGDPED